MKNETQYDLDRKAAKIYVFSPNNLYKYEYLTGEDLDIKPGTIEQAKSEYSLLGKTFNKGWDKVDQKEELFKRLQNIQNDKKDLIRGDDNESIYYIRKSEFGCKEDGDKYKKPQQNNSMSTKPPNVFDYLKSLSQEAKDLMDEIRD